MTALIAMLVVALDPALPAYQPRAVSVPPDAGYALPDGSLRIVGADHVENIVEQFDALFARTHPGFRFTLQLKGTTTAMPALTHGITLVGPMGREVNEVELVPYRKIVGEKPVELRVAHDSNTSSKLATNLAVYVNAANPLSALSAEQVARIFAAGHPKGALTRWGQAGTPQEWGDRAIHPYFTPPYTGFGDYLEKHHLGGLPPAPSVEQCPNTEQILARVAADPAGIGIAAIGRTAPGLKQVAIAGSLGTDEDVVSGNYPYARYLYFYARRAPGQPLDPVVREYLRLILSREGQQIIASQRDGYLPLTAREAAAELAKLDGANR